MFSYVTYKRVVYNIMNGAKNENKINSRQNNYKTLSNLIDS